MPTLDVGMDGGDKCLTFMPVLGGQGNKYDSA